MVFSSDNFFLLLNLNIRKSATLLFIQFVLKQKLSLEKINIQRSFVFRNCRKVLFRMARRELFITLYTEVLLFLNEVIDLALYFYASSISKKF